MTFVSISPAPASSISTVSRAPVTLLRWEAAMLFVVALIGYHFVRASWGEFALLFLLPDLALVGYLMGARIGAIAYNLVHTTTTPLALGIAGVYFPGLLPIALIWLAHIGMDRALGFGLKYPTSFGDTHLGRKEN